ncbi:MAG TPA: 30S ribosomal protein S20 [Gemmataceae bacterium]
MPHTKSAEKSLRQDEKRRLRNRAAKKAIKGQIKTFLGALNGGDAATELKAAIRKLDKAAAKRVIHPNAAARKKSQLARKLAAAKAGAK